MKWITRPVAAAALVAAGVATDRVLAIPAASPNVSAAAASTTSARGTTGASASNAARSAAASGTASDAVTERAFATASRSVVYVNNVGVGSGSGVIYDTTGDIVTNAHVVANAQTLRVTLSTGKTYAARLVGTDTADDLAIVHIDASGLPAARFASGGTFSVAQTVLAIGNPLGLKQSVTSGLISALDRTVQEGNGAYLPNAIQTSAPINPGNSGGALVTLDGAVVGIPTLEATDPQNNNGGAAQGIGFAVPSTRVTYVAHQIITTGRVAHTGRAYLGVGASDPQSQPAQGQGGFFGNGGGANTPVIAGAVINNVANGSPAAQAGAQQGDVITAVNGVSISGQNDLLTALAHQKPNETIALTLNRNGSTLTIHARLGELPAS